MPLSRFLRERALEILSRRSAAPAGGRVPEEALRELLLALADALEHPPGEARSTLGPALAHTGEPLTLGELAGEICSLRASVLAVWTETGTGDPSALADAARFDRALDQVLLDAMLAFGRSLDYSMNHSLAVIGHDLRNSLGAISMSSSLLARAGSLP